MVSVWGETNKGQLLSHTFTHQFIHSSRHPCEALPAVRLRKTEELLPKGQGSLLNSGLHGVSHKHVWSMLSTPPPHPPVPTMWSFLMDFFLSYPKTHLIVTLSEVAANPNSAQEKLEISGNQGKISNLRALRLIEGEDIKKKPSHFIIGNLKA